MFQYRRIKGPNEWKIASWCLLERIVNRKPNRAGHGLRPLLGHRCLYRFRHSAHERTDLLINMPIPVSLIQDTLSHRTILQSIYPKIPALALCKLHDNEV